MNFIEDSISGVFCVLCLYALMFFTYYLFYMMMDSSRKEKAKKCNYDCSKCKVWDCQSHGCTKKRGK